MLARSLPVSEGSELEFDIWNGKHRYLIKLKVDKREEIKIGKKKVLADKVIPTVKKLTESEGEKRIKSVVMWVSADERREILKIESEVLLGSITATLTGIEPFAAASLPMPVDHSTPNLQEAKSKQDPESQSRAMLQAPTSKQ